MLTNKFLCRAGDPSKRFELSNPNRWKRKIFGADGSSANVYESQIIGVDLPIKVQLAAPRR